MKLCKGCMEQYDDNLKICPHCGYEEGTPPQNSLHMMPGVLLANRYIVGKVLGYGGFGVTYIAWDGMLQTKVAIKEYFPSELSTRTLGETKLVVFGDDKKQRFEEGLKKFVSEAKRLVKFNSTEGIVKIFDAFEANNTAYLVMELLEGETIESLVNREKKISAEKTVEMMIPVIKSLKKVHEAGIIHRDISPDNLILTNEGEVKLIDFGSARYATAENEQSLTVMIKKGYSPEEQYRSHGGIGAYTDVYALAATMYKMITGHVPADSLERRVLLEKKGKDVLAPIRKYDRSIDENYETAIMNALNIRSEDRTPDMTAFLSELTGGEMVLRREGKIKKKETFKWPLWAKITIPSAAVLLIVFIALLSTGVLGSKTDMKTDIDVPEDGTRVPYVVSHEVKEGAQELSDAQLNMMIIGKQASDKIPEDRILSQDVNGGSIVLKNSLVNVKVSSPNLQQVVPNVRGMEKKKVTKELEKLDLNVKTDEQYSNVIEKGCVVKQSVEPFEVVNDESDISVTISKGSSEEVKEEEITVPCFVGMKYNDVLDKAEEIGCTIMVSAYEYNKDFDRDVLISQSPEEDTKIKNTQPIEIVVSLGDETVLVPNVELRTEDKARSQLSGRGLKAEVTYQTDEMILEGLVISQDPKRDTEVFPDSAVKLVVSSGSAKTKMPNVIGMQENEAYALLSTSGLSVNVDYKHDEKSAEGEVLSQSIDEGVEIKRGDEVVITAATRSQVKEVPDVVGKAQSKAEEEITANDLTPVINNIDENMITMGVVVSQVPKAGIHQKEKGSVTLNIGISLENNKEDTDSETDNSEEELTVSENEEAADNSENESKKDNSSKSESTTSSKKDTSSTKSNASSRKESSSSKTSSVVSNVTSSSSGTASSETSSHNTTTSMASETVSNSGNNTSRASSSVSSSVSSAVSHTSSKSEVQPTGISISENDISLAIGETAQLTAAVSPSNATHKDVTWNSDNTGVANVNNGFVTAVGEGWAIVTASTSNGMTAQCTVTVRPVGRENTPLLNSGDCGNAGNNIRWELYDSGTMYVFGNGEMQDYDASGNGSTGLPGGDSIPWNSNMGNITHVIIEDGVTSIGAGTFYNAGNLTSVEIPNSVTSIYAQAFEGCRNLSRIDLPNNLYFIDSRAFAFCPIREIVFPESLKVINFEVFFNGSSGGNITTAYFKGDKPITSPFISKTNNSSIGTFADWETVYYPEKNPTWIMNGDIDELAIFGTGGTTKFIPYNP